MVKLTRTRRSVSRAVAKASVSVAFQPTAAATEAARCLSHSPSPKMPTRAKTTKGSIADRGAAARLAELLEDKNSSVREAAAEALGKLGDQAAIPSLTLAALESEPLVRFSAVEALLRIGGDAVVVPISNALNDEPAIIRFRAVQALDELADPRAIPDLIKRLEDEAVPQWQDRRVCDVAAEALKRFDAPEAQNALEAWQTRQEAAAALESANDAQHKRE